MRRVGMVVGLSSPTRFRIKLSDSNLSFNLSEIRENDKIISHKTLQYFH